MKKVLVTGGCGYIGSHTIVDLIENGFEPFSVDNNSRSSEKILEGIFKITGGKIKNYKVDLCDLEATKEVFQENKDVIGVIDFAAYKTVPESVAKPLLYYHNNISSLVNLLTCMEEFNIPNFVFSSSCSVYGNVEKLPVTENTPMGEAECAYARTKQMGEQIISDFSKVSKTQLVSLRYFNPIGAHESALIGEVPFNIPDNLAPIITQTAIGKRKEMFVHGNDYPTRDGTCIRDYIHIMDIANAHTKALQYLNEKRNKSNYEIFNLGSGTGTTVLEAIKAFEKVSGKKLNYKTGSRRAGDVVAIYSDNSKTEKILQWKPKRNIENMMLTAWKWELNLNKQ